MTQQKSDQQRLWELERNVEDAARNIAKLLALWEGTEKQTGARDNLRDIKNEIKYIADLAKRIETLDQEAVRKQEVIDVHQRLIALEKRDLKEDGTKVGRKAVFTTISAVVGFFVLVFGAVSQIGNWLQKLLGGGQ